jgi:hypothetical protein
MQILSIEVLEAQVKTSVAKDLGSMNGASQTTRGWSLNTQLRCT